MINVQIISKTINTGKMGILDTLPVEYFIGYEEEVTFINKHFKKYHKPPDEATFIAKFKEFTTVTVGETDEYLHSTLMEEVLYHNMIPIINKVVEVMKTDSREAVDMLMAEVEQLPKVNGVGSRNIIKEALKRYHSHMDTDKETLSYIPTGIPQLDSHFNGGLMKGEEFCVIFARIGNGKSWFGLLMAMGAWLSGARVGFISPEMSVEQIGYRFDTLYKGFNNRDLIGKRKVHGYEDYIKKLRKEKIPFEVATLKDFSDGITVSKIKNFVISNELDIVFIDGITYIKDERKKNGENANTALTHISEDLMEMSTRLKIPVVVAVQTNRQGVKKKTEEDEEAEEELPDLEHIKDSDGIAANASRAIALRMKNDTLTLQVRKNRYGVNGGKLLFSCALNTGNIRYIPSAGDSVSEFERETTMNRLKEHYSDEGAL